MLLLVLLLAAAAWGVTVVDDAGLERLSFAPGESVYVYFDEPGLASVEVVDVSTGHVVVKRDFEVRITGKYLLWRTTPNTAQGEYRVYIVHNGLPYIYNITIGGRLPPLVVPLVAVAVAGAAVAALWVASRRGVVKVFKPPVKGEPVYFLQLPTGVRLQVRGSYMVFGREFFARVGVPQELLKYISRVHFAITFSGGAYYIEDLGSKNGTFLNGRSIRGLGAQLLRPGDIISVAQVVNLQFLGGRST
jgi:hypothetical protein